MTPEQATEIIALLSVANMYDLFKIAALFGIWLMTGVMAIRGR